MENKKPVWKTLFVIISIALIVGINAYFVFTKVQEALQQRQSCGEYQVYEVTVLLDSNNTDAAARLKEARTRKVTNAVKYSLALMIVPDIAAVIVLASIYKIIARLTDDEPKTFVGPILAIVITVLCMACLGLYTQDYIARAKNAATSVRAHAPVIYLYNDGITPINVSIGLNGEFTYTYPRYNEEHGWNVMASPDGILTSEAGNQFEYLFWEGDVYFEPDLSRGFCVAGEDTESFLRDAAVQLGLNENESAFFVSYWAPRMEGNNYNVITFQTTAFDEAAKLNITPVPDVLVRVNMLWFPSDDYVEIEPQNLMQMSVPLSERHGFTAVEWGGEMLGE